MESRSSGRPVRPQSVKELSAQAELFNYNANIAFKQWTRAAETLYQEASFAISDCDYGRAYVMLLRHSLLVLDLLPSHPQFTEAENRKAHRALTKRIDRVLNQLEQIKPVLDEDYAEWERMTSAAKREREPSRRPKSYQDFSARDPSLTSRAKVLDAAQHQDLAVDLAQKELARRDEARRAYHASSNAQGTARPGLEGQDDLQQLMESARQTLSFNQHAGARLHGNTTDTRVARTYNYPSISKSEPIQYSHDAPPLPVVGPRRPPKERVPSPHRPRRPPEAVGQAPAVPHKVPQQQGQQEYHQPVETTGPPMLPPKHSLDKPPLPRKERLAFKPGAYLENGDALRSVFLPSKLRATFLDLASKNTRAGLEMCGVLCGTPVNNALFVRCLVIPDQKCTSDTCETENEGALFDYCASQDLLVLGWIHTHPTQTCFMSSRDLHTHAGYQVMMPESIAIVCAPRFQPSYGIFRLTHPPGLNHVLDCRQQSTFHQHAIDNIYRDTEHPDGHVYESDKMTFSVHDLRTTK